MTLSWCGSEPVEINSGGPSECFNASITSIIPILYLAAASIQLVRELRHAVVYHYMDPADRRMLYIFSSMFVVMALVAILHAAFRERSASVITSGIIQALAWLMCIPLIQFEAHRMNTWPSYVLRFFFVIELVTNAIQYASFRRTDYDGVSTARVVGISCVGFLCNISLALIGLFKEQLQPTNERYGLVTELDTFTFSHNPRKSGTLSSLFSWMWPYTTRRSAATSHGRTDSLDELLMAEGGEVSALDSRLSVGRPGRLPSFHREEVSDTPAAEVPISELILRRATIGAHSSHNRNISDSSHVSYDELDYSDTAMIPAGPHAPAYNLSIKRWEVQWQAPQTSTTPGLDVRDPEYFSDEDDGTSMHNSSMDGGADWDPGIPIVEFEINIRCTPSAELEWWGKGHRGEVRWTVWRTAKDVLDLHTALLAQNGQHMPVKRPRLRTNVTQEAANNATSRASFGRNSLSGSQSRLLNHDDIQRDMRSITAYLRTLLSYRRLHGSVLTEFLGANEAALPDLGELEPPKLYPDGDERDQTTRMTITEADMPRPSNPMVEDMLQVQRERYKRILGRLRQELPPRAVSVRLRTFVEVVPGHDIVETLLRLKLADSRDSAHTLAQQLLESHLLTPICCGFQPWEGQQPPDPAELRKLYEKFRGAPTFLYSYEANSTFYVGPVATFGADGQKGRRRDSLFSVELDVQVVDYLISRSGERSNRSSAPAGENPMATVVFRIMVSHDEDGWEVLRRFREFVQLDKRLQRIGVTAPTPLPAKSMFRLSEQGLTQRQAGLQQFLDGVLQLARESPSSIGPLLAAFLDPLFDKLIIVDSQYAGRRQQHPHHDLPTVEEDVELERPSMYLLDEMEHREAEEFDALADTLFL